MSAMSMFFFSKIYTVPVIIIFLLLEIQAKVDFSPSKFECSNLTPVISQKKKGKNFVLLWT